MKAISLLLSGALLATSGALVFACSNETDDSNVGLGSTTEEVRDELHYVLARCERKGEPLTDRGRGLESAEITLTLGKRGKKRAVTHVRAVVKTVNGRGEGNFDVVAGGEAGGLADPSGTWIFVSDEDERGKLKIASQSDALDYIVIARQDEGRSFIELGQGARDPIANAVDCTFDRAAWRVTEDPSCINLLGGKDVKEKLTSIPTKCWTDLDGGTGPDAGKAESPVVDAGPPSDDGGKGGKDDPPLPKWPDPNDESDNDDSPSANEPSEPASEDAGAKKKAPKQEAGGCDIALRSRANGLSAGLLFLIVVALCRRRSVC